MKLLGQQVMFAKLMIGNMVWACNSGELYRDDVWTPTFPKCPNNMFVAEHSKYNWVSDRTPLTILDAALGERSIFYHVLYKGKDGMETGWIDSRKTVSTPPHPVPTASCP